ncbi:hypothetical protein SR870_17010 [Rhodopseudomonas palustris]|uniref:hypothetical protein n=1 Tax=Rhodopseudomonas palustris TaxID=1076 RepID=UPI002ACD451D|nr:hypothetical protein [Rhodopseudomonas palustris]WQG98391.1 hypothetical protein SR870_17010 [Rhodopseudomonas palustris]
MLLDSANILDRNDSRARSTQILVGVLDTAGIAEGKLSLSHKSLGRQYASATEFVAEQSDETIEEWRSLLGGTRDFERPFAGLSIVIDDASPDTCLTLIALARRLNGKRLDARWIEYASRWERGFIDSGCRPDESFGALLSALGHVELQESVNRKADASSEAFAAALSSCVTYAEGLIDLRLSPTRLPRTLETASHIVAELHDRAHSRLAYEEAVYRRLRAAATRLQLAVHLAGSRRKTVVDAILFSERIITSSLKIFARSDASTFTGHGFAFQATYRPDLSMSGNDFTVSTDPLASLDLRDLWIELERIEEERWREFAARPNGFARPRGQLGAGNRVLPSHSEPWSRAEPCHQPWYEEMGRRSLLAAPRGIEWNGQIVPGTQLTWADVKEAIWRVYAPTLGFRLRPLRGDGPGLRLTDSPEETKHLRARLVDGVDLHIVLAERVNSLPDDIALWTPTLTAACASFIQTGESSIDSLAPADSFDLVEERGGIAIISDHGAMFVQMSMDGGFPAEAADAAAKRVARKVKSAIDMEREIEQRLRGLVEAAIGTGSESSKREALKALFGRKLIARRIWRETQNLEPDPLVHRLRSLCERRWRARERFDAAMAEIDELERMVVSSSEVRANSVLNYLAMVGLPFSLAGNVLGGLIILDNGKFGGIALSVLIGYTAIALIAGLLIFLFARFQNRQWRMPDQETNKTS